MTNPDTGIIEEIEFRAEASPQARIQAEVQVADAKTRLETAKLLQEVLEASEVIPVD